MADDRRPARRLRPAVLLAIVARRRRGRAVAIVALANGFSPIVLAFAAILGMAPWASIIDQREGPPAQALGGALQPPAALRDLLRAELLVDRLAGHEAARRVERLAALVADQDVRGDRQVRVGRRDRRERGGPEPQPARAGSA